MWADYDFGGNDHAFDMVSLRNTSGLNKPIMVLPATAEAYEQMVEQGAIALNTKSSLGQSWLGLQECSRKYFRDESSVVLRAIGITASKK